MGAAMEQTLLLSTGPGEPPIEGRVIVDIELDGPHYVLLTPVRTLATLVRDDRDGLEEVEPSQLSDAAFQPVVRAIEEKLAPHGLALDLISGRQLALKGEMTGEIAELCDSLSIGSD